jgi:hypothetical protein
VRGDSDSASRSDIAVDDVDASAEAPADEIPGFESRIAQGSRH